MSGLLAAVAGMAAAHLVAGLVSPAASPVLAVGSAVIDLTPTPVKEFAVARFGTADKPILLGSVTFVTLLVAGLAGVLSRRRPRAGAVVVVVLTGLATVAALLRPVAGPVDAVPGLVAAAVGVAVLLRLRRALGGPSSGGSAPGRATGAGELAAQLPHPAYPRAGLPHTAYPTAHDGRRQFLVGAAGVSAGAAGAVVLGQRLAEPAGPSAARLPAAADAAGAFPAGLERRVAGVSPLRTSQRSFYRVDTALVVPRVDADRWRLELDGMVDRPFTIGYTELLAMPMVERDITMTCVSNEVGGGYVGAARWLGVRLTDLLDRAGVRSGSDQLLSTAVDGFTIGTPMDVVRDGRDALVAVAMNGEPLSAVHGYPARMITPGLYGFVGATKWLTRLTATTYAEDRAYWTERGWATAAPVKTASRIDTPRALSTVRAGKTAVGGVAWAQRRGIRSVEVRVDDGPWQAATLGPDVGVDYWRQWFLPWEATSGRHDIAVRATDGTGTLQDSARATPFPNGASGLQQIVVFVS